MSRYSGPVEIQPGIELVACLACGAAIDVDLTDQHDVFHNVLKELAVEAVYRAPDL